MHVDKMVRMARGAIREGSTKDTDAIVSNFCNKCDVLLFQGTAFNIGRFTDEALSGVLVHSGHTAGGLDGFNPENKST